MQIATGTTARVAGALQARLAVAFPPAKFALDFLPAKLDGKIWSLLLRRTPFVGIGLVGLNSAAPSPRRWAGRARFVVALVVENKGGVNAQLFGDSFAPGIANMMDATVAILQGYTADGIGSFATESAEMAFSEAIGDTYSLAMVHVECAVMVNLADAFSGPELTAPDLISESWTWNFQDGTSYSETVSP